MNKEYLQMCNIVEQQGTLRLFDAPSLRNHVHTLHAGALFSLVSASLGRYFRLRQEEMGALQHQVRYLKPAKGHLSAETTASKETLGLYLTTVVNEKGEPVAQVESSSQGGNA